MNVTELIKQANLNTIVLPDPEREITGVYTGDLLSWVMGKAREGDAWITIMSNPNVIAVATLSDVSCVIFAEGVTPDENITAIARSKGVNLLSSDLSSFETAKMLVSIGL